MNLASREKEVTWDGTMNMPMYRLAAKDHKDSYMIMFRWIISINIIIIIIKLIIYVYIS